MKKKFILLIFSLIIVSSPIVSAEETKQDNACGENQKEEEKKPYVYQINAQPNPKGSKTTGMGRYLFTDTLFASAFFGYEKRQDDFSFENMPDSLILEKSESVNLDLFFEYSVSLLDGSLRFVPGAGLTGVYSQSSQKGHFLSGPNYSVYTASNTNQVFENLVKFYILGPKLQLSSFFKLDDILSIEHVIGYVPLYTYSLKQIISLRPLIAGETTYTAMNNSAPYLTNELKIAVFDLAELQLNHEYQILQYKEIAPVSNADRTVTTFQIQPKTSYQINNLSFLINLKPVIMDKIIILGVGKRYLQTKNQTTGVYEVDSSEWIFNIGFGKKM
ncbi:MAG: hypothetical protein A2Y41_11310 [Spirochaetes bacterium GWB1_36_13]|nr:MAG: hypothetical protein A2Y41_11310 [Spirochaetes bacterium GWB1_36_13]